MTFSGSPPNTATKGFHKAAKPPMRHREVVKPSMRHREAAKFPIRHRERVKRAWRSQTRND